ncbi:hypothetical protein WUBG_02952 [Wuchereria bancrofti]|uniref:Uncharacterized protein n=1 Tax=Wuchereria bancrofti TaxID=6293 RepID=J9F9C4_WUCBA|nr:hypothetical protein WUBG_02952 [Wuchereria bancrofti]
METRIGRLRTTILDAPEESGISPQHHATTTIDATSITNTANSSATETSHIIYRSFAHNISNTNWRLFRWFAETSESEILEIGDEDWNPPVPESSFCNAKPITGINSTTMQRSLCPWQWKLNHDESREPKIISEAHCLCRRSRGTSGSFCMPIKRQVAVLKRIRCDPTTGYYEYTRALQTVTVGCHSVLPRSQKASPLAKLYRKTNTVEI